MKLLDRMEYLSYFLAMFEEKCFCGTNRTMNALAGEGFARGLFFFGGILFSLNLFCSYFVHNMSYTNGSLIA